MVPDTFSTHDGLTYSVPTNTDSWPANAHSASHPGEGAVARRKKSSGEKMDACPASGLDAPPYSSSAS